MNKTVELGRFVITENLPENEVEINKAVCPECGRTFTREDPNWGTETCPHCGQKLIWK